MATCPACEASLTEGEGSCRSCGNEVAPRAGEECARCGEPIVAGGGVCPACGELHPNVDCASHPGERASSACIVCGLPICTACDHGPGPYHLCPAHRNIPIIQGWAQVYTAADDIEAELIRDNLLAEGIEAEVLSQKDHFSFRLDVGVLGPVRVLVPAFAYEEASELIRARMDARGEVVFACPSCGEAYESGDEVCATCGAPLP